MNKKTLLLCETAVMMAFVYTITRFIQIPIPLGYFNIGNCVILLFCILIPNPYGIAGASIGSALADLTSFPVYTLPTLIIKALMPLVFYLIADKWSSKKVGYILAAAVSTLIPLFGYTLTGGIIYGNLYTGLAQFPGLLLEYAANLIIFGVLYAPVMRIVSKYSIAA